MSGWRPCLLRKTPALAAVLLTVLSGCEAVNPGNERPVQVKFGSWGSPKEFALYREVIKRFESANPDIRISPLFIPFRSYFTKVQLLLAGGVGPDVMLVSSPMVYQLKVHGHMENLQPYVDRERESNPGYLTEDEYYIDMLKPACTFDGDFYYLPMAPMSLHVYYSKTAFDAAGVAYPEEGWTWDDFREAARRLTVRENGRTTQWGTMVWNWDGMWRAFLLQNGADAFDDPVSPTRCLLGSPEAMETFAFLQDLIYRDHSSPSPAQASQMGGDFLTGKLAMQIHGTWMVEQYRQIRDFDWDMAPLPTRRKYANVVTVGGVAMASSCEHKEAAWRFMRHLLSDETQRLMSTESATWQPTRRQLAESPYVHEVPGVPEHHYLRFKELERAVPGEVLRHPNAQELCDVLNRELEPIFLGKKSPEECLPAVVEKVNRFLSEHPSGP